MIVARTPAGDLCDACYRKNPASFKTCTRCGIVEHLHHFGLCCRCVVEGKVADLLGDYDPDERPELHRLHAALVDSKPDSMLQWLDRSAAP